MVLWSSRASPRSRVALRQLPVPPCGARGAGSIRDPRVGMAAAGFADETGLCASGSGEEPRRAERRARCRDLAAPAGGRRTSVRSVWSGAAGEDSALRRGAPARGAQGRSIDGVSRCRRSRARRRIFRGRRCCSGRSAPCSSTASLLALGEMMIPCARRPLRGSRALVGDPRPVEPMLLPPGTPSTACREPEPRPGRTPGDPRADALVLALKDKAATTGRLLQRR